MVFQIKKAERKKVYVKVALMGSSGGGKTYSSLRLATGMAEEIKNKTGILGKIAMINTESDRGYYYANEFDYDIVDLGAPFHPERYIEAINYVISKGYDILIIDSTSHEWEGKGGCLELHSKAGGKYQDWAKVTPIHNKFIDSMADSKIHIIATMRGKDQYDMSKDDNGKTIVQKLGIGAKQREGFEYEFTCTFNLDQNTNMADVKKDNTHIFDDEICTLLTENHGEKLIQWAMSAVEQNKVNERKIESVNSVLEEVEKNLKADSLPAEFEDEQKYPENLYDVTTEMYKNCSDTTLKKEITSIVKQYGKFTDVSEDVLKEIYDKLNNN